MGIIDSLENQAFVIEETIAPEKLISAHKFFPTNLKPENGIYGIQEIIKGESFLEKIGINDIGHSIKEYFWQDKKFRQLEKLGAGYSKICYFDDNGAEYLQKIVHLGANKARIVGSELAKDTTIVKKNFTSATDSYGRPVLNKITDLQLRPTDQLRESLDSIERGPFYRDKDQKGHIIADSFGGPASPENVVAQLDSVNLSKMARVENIVRELKEKGHKVDYEVKVNYASTKDKRPSSFEPTITVDGGKYLGIPKELTKIYNDSSQSQVHKFFMTGKEIFSQPVDLGLKQGLNAMGLTLSVSIVDNLASVLDGQISIEDMAVNIVKDTASSGLLGFGATFGSEFIAKLMRESASKLIHKVGSSCLPALAASMTVELYGNISDYVQGKIGADELMYELGDSVIMISGGFIATALAGSVGLPAVLVISTVGCAIASEIYKAAVEHGAEYAEVYAQNAEDFAKQTLDKASEFVPDKLKYIESALEEYILVNDLPFKV